MATTSVEHMVTKLGLYAKSSIPQALADQLLTAAKASRPQISLVKFQDGFNSIDLDTFDQLDLTCVHQVCMHTFEVRVKAKLGGEMISGDIWYACTFLSVCLNSLLHLCTQDTPLKGSDLLDCFSSELVQYLTSKKIRLTSNDVLLSLDEPVDIWVGYDS